MLHKSWIRWGGAVLILLLGIGAYLFYQFTHLWRDTPALSLPDTPESIRSITLTRKEDTLRLLRQGEAWYVNDCTGKRATPQLINSLLECLWACKVGAPIEMPALQDSLISHFTTQGLHVELTPTKGTPIRYILAPWADSSLALCTLSTPPCFYQCAFPGYRPEVILQLSLYAWHWEETRIGVERPTDLRSVHVFWHDTQSGFTLHLDSTSKQVILQEEAPLSTLTMAPSLPYDTLRLSTFLYSLTQLQYLSTQQAVQHWVSHIPHTQPPLFSLTLHTIYGDTLLYTLYPLPNESTLPPPLQAEEHAVLTLPHGITHPIALGEWAMTMIRLESLRPTTSAASTEP